MERIIKIVKPFAQLQEESNHAGVEFLFTELDAGRTFLDVADTTQDAETRMRNRENARVAYGALMRYRPRVILEEAQQSDFDDKLNNLKQRLQEAGVPV